MTPSPQDLTSSMAQRPQSELLARRKELHLTQQELADLAGVSVRFIHELENGKSTVRLDRLLAVANTLGLELSWRLIQRTDEPARP